MSDAIFSSNVHSNHKPIQKPVFIIEPFDSSNVEHMKGNISLVLNKRFALDLCRLIKECDLDKDEGYFLQCKEVFSVGTKTVSMSSRIKDRKFLKLLMLMKQNEIKAP